MKTICSAIAEKISEMNSDDFVFGALLGGLMFLGATVGIIAMILYHH